MFAPQALAGLNVTYQATCATPEEARAWAREHFNAEGQAEVEALITKGETLNFIDGELLTNESLDEQYRLCDGCGKYVFSEPLTWGVMQYQSLDDGVLCNACYAAALPKALAKGRKNDVIPGWPVQGRLTWDQFRHALDERVVEKALEEAGYTKVEGKDGEGDFDTFSASRDYSGETGDELFHRFRDYVWDHPDQQFVVTRILWQFAADATLWTKQEVARG